MRPTTIRTLLLALAVTAGLASPVAADDPPPAEVRLPGPAHQGQDQTFTGTVRVRCAPGHEVESLFFTFSRAGGPTTTRDSEVLPACTGSWESVPYVSGEGYPAGRAATVEVEVAVADGSGSSELVSIARDLWVRPAARVRFPDQVTLLDSGEIRATVRVRCDEPWWNFATFVGVTQDGVGHEPRVVEDVPCDGAYRRRVALLSPVEGDFRTGWARLSVDITLENEDDFGPYLDASRRVWVKRT